MSLGLLWVPVGPSRDFSLVSVWLRGFLLSVDFFCLFFILWRIRFSQIWTLFNEYLLYLGQV